MKPRIKVAYQALVANSGWLVFILTLVLYSALLSAQQPDQPSAPSEQASSLPAAPPSSNSALPLPAPADPQSKSSSSAPSSAPLRPKFWSNWDPNAQVTVLENTLLRVRTTVAMSTRQTRAGTAIAFTLGEDVVVDGVSIIPRGAVIHGTVVESKQPGTLSGSPELILELSSLDLGGRSYPLYTYQFRVQGTSKTKPTETKVRTGAVIGAVVGGVFSGSANGETTAVGKLAGVATGATLGAGTGALVAVATPGPTVSVPAESEIDFYLSSPISVVPATEKEANRLSQGLHPGGPVLYVRGDAP